MPLLEVDHLSITYQTRSGPYAAVDDVSFDIEKGQSLGIVGESGCGKTTIGMGLLRLLPANGSITGGSIRFAGDNLVDLPVNAMQAIRWKRISMIFQAAMNAWNPVQRVGDQIIEAIRTHYPQTSRAEATEMIKRLYDAVDIPQGRIFDYPHEYSGGMKQRAIIAMALSCEPDLVIADEPTTALDVIVQDQIIQKLKAIQDERNIAVIFISHDIGVVAEVCHTIMVMYKGKIVESGTREEVFGSPAHPYTRALLASYLTIDGVMDIHGDPELKTCTPAGSLSGGICGYLPHCREADGDCRRLPATWQEISSTHKARCRLCR